MHWCLFSVIYSTKKMKDEVMTDPDDGFDVLLTNIGFGQWQAPIILATVLVAAQLPLHLVGSPLLSAPMAFHCSPTPPADNQSAFDSLRSNSSAVYFNSTCLSSSVSIEDIMVSDEIYNGTGYFTGLPLCPYVEYDTSIFTSTIISQFHLICDQSELRPLFQMMYSIGGLIGSSLGGVIGDRFGRKKAVQVGCVCNLIAVVLAVVVPSYSFILFMRFIIGVMMVVMLLPAWSLALEVTPSRHRSLVGMLMGLPYSFAVISSAGIAYFIREWEYLLLTSIVPGIVLFPLAMYIDDSPSWLLQKGEIEKATKILKNAVRTNKAKLSTPLETTVEKLAEQTAKSPEGGAEEKEVLNTLSSRIQEILTYIRSPAMRIILIMSPLLWFLQSFLYLGVAINANNFTSSGPFLYVALTGVMDGSAIILSTPLATRIGRKIMLFTGMFGGAVLFLLDLLVPKEYYGAKWVLVMGGFLLVGSAFQVNFVYAPELFPTETRARGFGFLNLVGNIGFICAPLITEIFAKYAWWAAGVTFGCAGILASFTIPLLPETRNIPLPETLQDVEDRRNNARIKSKEKEVKGVDNIGFSEQAEKSV